MPDSALKQFARKSKHAIIAHKIYSNWKMKRQFGAGDIQSNHGSTHSRWPSPAQSLEYIDAQFTDYLRYARIGREQLRGMRVFELGFGDNVGVALRFLVAGAAQVVCLDKFYSRRDPEQQRRIYLALRDTLSDDEKSLFDEAVDLNGDIVFNPEKLRCLYGSDVQDARDLDDMSPFDLAISRAAIQDIYDPGDAFAAMDRLLASGGLQMHKIDLSDQGMFRDQDFNPLMFLTIPDSVYRLMAIDSGRPNRKLANYYRDKMNELGYDAEILVTGVIGTDGKGDLNPFDESASRDPERRRRALELLEAIRPNLDKQFRDLSDEDLVVDSIFVVARKR